MTQVQIEWVLSATNHAGNSITHKVNLSEREALQLVESLWPADAGFVDHYIREADCCESCSRGFHGLGIPTAGCNCACHPKGGAHEESI